MGGGSDSKKQLGKILLAQKLVSADVLQDMLDEQKRDPTARLGSVATRRGRVSVHDALQALSEQHGVPPVDLAELVIPLSLLKLVPVEMAREHALLPFKVDGDQLLLAMSSPQLRDVIDELEFVVAKKITPYVALDHVVRQVIEYAYGRLEQGDEHYIGSAVSNSQLHQLGLPADSPRAPEPAMPAALIPGAEAGEDEDEDEDRLNTTIAAPLSDASGLAAALDTAFTDRVMPSQPPVMPAPQADARVLIAHRDEPLRQALRSTLQETGVAVDEASDGNQALELLRAQHPWCRGSTCAGGCARARVTRSCRSWSRPTAGTAGASPTTCAMATASSISSSVPTTW